MTAYKIVPGFLKIREIGNILLILHMRPLAAHKSKVQNEASHYLHLNDV